MNLALYLNLDYPAAVFRRGSIRAELGEYEKAIEDFNEAIKSKAQDANTYYTDAYYKRGLAYLNLIASQNIQERLLRLVRWLSVLMEKS